MPCTILPYSEDPSEEMTAFIDEQAYVAGSQDSKVTMLVFTDFQCPGCAKLAASLDEVLQAHPNDVRLVVRFLPDGRFDKSRLAFQASEAANLQGQFWEMYALLFEKQSEWALLSPEQFPAWVSDQAMILGMDGDQFLEDFSSESVQNRVQQFYDSAASVDYFPPLLYINSASPYNGLADPSSLDTMVRLAMLDAKKFHTCPGWSVDPSRQYIATLHTARGEVVLQLYPEKVPLAVNNFLFLVRSGWYDNISFHRVTTGFAAQTGDPSGTGYGNPGYYFSTEAASGMKFDRPGLVAMANTGVDTNGSQFFITYAADPTLDGKFTIFGEVIAGWEALSGLSSGDSLMSIQVGER